jgi:hypothetical protein
MLDISYEIWEDTYKRNIRPLPIWWSSEDSKRKKYEAFTKFLRTRKVEKEDYDKS